MGACSWTRTRDLQPTHFVMLSVQLALGLPCLLAPSARPVVVKFSNESSIFRVMNSKHLNFLDLDMCWKVLVYANHFVQWVMSLCDTKSVLPTIGVAAKVGARR